MVIRCPDIKDCTDEEILETIGFPDADPLPGDDRNMPYFIVADDVFALSTWLMKPFSGKNLNNQQYIFKYRLSRA